MAVLKYPNLLVVGATGRTGRRVVRYALEAGHRVTAVARSLEGNFGPDHERLKRVACDVARDNTFHDLVKGQDAVVSTLGAKGDLNVLVKGMENVIAAMKAAGVQRLIAVGGAGVLPEPDGRLRAQRADFPPLLAGISNMHFKAYERLRESGLQFTFMAPPFTPEGNRTGHYLLAAEAFPEGGSSQVSVEDLADAIVNELQTNAFVGNRVGIAYPVQETVQPA